MRFARISYPGAAQPILAAVSADGTQLDLRGRTVPIPPGGFAPATTGWIYGPLLNERSSWDRFGDQLSQPPYGAPPTVPPLYFKPPNTHVGHGARVRLPAYADRVELGVSIGMVFGRPVARTAPDAAWDAVVGCVLVLDLSVPNPSVYRPPVQEKCFDGACPVGPWVVDRADLPALESIALRSFVNGALVAERRCDDLVRGPAQLIADVSDFMTLAAGDVLTLGYPVGAVPTAGRGDHIRVEADGLGVLACFLEEDAA